MKKRVLTLYKTWRGTDYRVKTMLTASFSSCITILFALWNGYLGLAKASVWHGSICVYYLLLSMNRTILLARERSGKARPTVRTVYLATNCMLIVMNLLLIVPITMMTKNQKPVSASLVIAIGVAAYTTYKVILAVFHLVRASRQEHLLIRELRVISLIDAIVAVMSLQTTLITSMGQAGSTSMLLLSAWTNAGMFLLIMGITCLSFRRGKRQLDVQSSKE